MKTYIVIFFIALLPCLLSAQTIERNVISSGGTATVTGTGMQVSQTIGEPMVKGFYPGSLIVTEGFQQSSPVMVSAEESLENTAAFTVYPNPVGDLLNVRIESTKALNLELSFTDIQGRSTILPSTQVAVNGSVTQSIDCAAVAAGTYLLMIRDTKTGSVQTLQVRKVD